MTVIVGNKPWNGHSECDRICYNSRKPLFPTGESVPINALVRKMRVEMLILILMLSLPQIKSQRSLPMIYIPPTFMLFFFLPKPFHFPLQLALSFLVTLSPTFSTLPTKPIILSFPSVIAGTNTVERVLFNSEPIEVIFFTQILPAAGSQMSG